MTAGNYMDGSGRMLTGWQYLNGCWYYMNGSGRMLTGWQQIGGIWYLLNDSGQMTPGGSKVKGYLVLHGRSVICLRDGGRSSALVFPGWIRHMLTVFRPSEAPILPGRQRCHGSQYMETAERRLVSLSSGGAMDTNAGSAANYVDETGAWDPDQEAPDYVWPVRDIPESAVISATGRVPQPALPLIITD